LEVDAICGAFGVNPNAKDPASGILPAVGHVRHAELKAPANLWLTLVVGAVYKLGRVDAPEFKIKELF
jgi:hypothetical protein